LPLSKHAGQLIPPILFSFRLRQTHIGLNTTADSQKHPNQHSIEALNNPLEPIPCSPTPNYLDGSDIATQVQTQQRGQHVIR
jgi:hypothetical protein